VIIVDDQLRRMEQSFSVRIALGVAAVSSLVLQLIPLLVAPARAISRRLIFLALGLLLLIALNELSKLGLDVAAPKASGLIHSALYSG
jgi:hypothetical protein